MSILRLKGKLVWFNTNGQQVTLSIDLGPESHMVAVTKLLREQFDKELTVEAGLPKEASKERTYPLNKHTLSCVECKDRWPKVAAYCDTVGGYRGGKTCEEAYFTSSRDKTTFVEAMEKMEKGLGG